MQKFYEELNKSKNEESNWKTQLTEISLEALKAFEVNALAWDVWEES